MRSELFSSPARTHREGERPCLHRLECAAEGGWGPKRPLARAPQGRACSMPRRHCRGPTARSLAPALLFSHRVQALERRSPGASGRRSPGASRRRPRWGARCRCAGASCLSPSPASALELVRSSRLYGCALWQCSGSVHRDVVAEQRQILGPQALGPRPINL